MNQDVGSGIAFIRECRKKVIGWFLGVGGCGGFGEFFFQCFNLFFGFAFFFSYMAAIDPKRAGADEKACYD